MFGQNPLRPPVKGDGQELDVQHIFPTIQGEGPFAGVPAVFVRLGGCNLACRFCDTEFESFQTISVDEIVSRVDALANGRKLVVITGGEPLRQPISRLCDALLPRYDVQIETNGTLFRVLDERVSFVCSPKSVNGRYAGIRADLMDRAMALKFIVSAFDEGYKQVAEVGQEARKTAVFVQPMDEGDDGRNADNLKLAIRLAAENGYRLCLQTHKLLGIE